MGWNAGLVLLFRRRVGTIVPHPNPTGVEPRVSTRPSDPRKRGEGDETLQQVPSPHLRQGDRMWNLRRRGILNPPPCGEGGRQAGGVLLRSEDPSPTPPHKGEGLHLPTHAFLCDCSVALGHIPLAPPPV